MIRNLTGKYFKSEFSKNILTLFSGNTISHVIKTLFVIVLGRYFFTPNDFGVYYLFNAIILILAEIATLKYEIAVVLTKGENSARHVLYLSYIISFVLSLCILLAVVFGKEIIFNVIDENNSLGNWVYFIPPVVFLSGVMNASNYWLNRLKIYKRVSTGRVFRSVLTGSVQVASGAKILHGVGLIGVAIVCIAVNSIYFVYHTFKSFKEMKMNFSFNRMIRIAKYFHHIPKYNTSLGLLNTLSNMMPIFILKMYYGEEAAGLYGIAITFVALPMDFIRLSINEVFYATATSVYNKDKVGFSIFVKGTIKKLVKLSVLPFIFLAVLAPYFFKYGFGEEWTEAGIYTRILVPMLFISFINTPIASIITILKKQKYFILYYVITLLFRFYGLYIGYHFFNSILYSIAFFSMAGFFFNLLLLFYLNFEATKIKAKI